MSARAAFLLLWGEASGLGPPGGRMGAGRNSMGSHRWVSAGLALGRVTEEAVLSKWAGPGVVDTAG